MRGARRAGAGAGPGRGTAGDRSLAHAGGLLEGGDRICAGALLFDRTYASGTRAGAIAVSRDIRATGMRRLRRIEAVPKPQRTARQDALWIGVERRLIEMYASDYLQIWEAIEAADTPAQRGALPAKLRAQADQPDRLEQQARALEGTLNLPDCTGGMKP